VLVFTGLVWFFSRYREPACGGKSLSEWVQLYAREGDEEPKDQTAANAIRHIGPDAVPYLLKWVSYDGNDGRFRRIAVGVVPRLPKRIRPDVLNAWARSDARVLRAAYAARAFALFQEESAVCMPPLVKLMKEDKSSFTAANSTYALACLGPEALPVFAATLASPGASTRVRGGIAQALGRRPELATNSASSVPLLLPRFNDADAFVRESAITSAGRIGARYQTYSTVAVPALTNCLAAERPETTRYLAARALASYSNAARIAVPLLLDFTNSPNPNMQRCLADALRAIVPEGVTNAPAN